MTLNNQKPEWVKQYKNQARKKLKELLSANKVDPEYLKSVLMQADGRCVSCDCNDMIAYEEPAENQIRYRFACGHSLLQVFLEEKITVSEDLLVGSLGSRGSQQKVQVSISGKKPKKEDDEVIAVRRYANFNAEKFDQIFNDIENSPVDVIAKHNSSYEYFQVTKLYGEVFWSTLYKNNIVDICTDTIVDLIEKAINRKIIFDPDEKKKIILLIDAWPGILETYINSARKDLSFLIKDAGFKHIYLVGSAKNNSYFL